MLSQFDLLLTHSVATLVCYDDSDTPPADPPADSTPPNGKTSFTQEELNKFLADDRRKNQQKVQALEGKLTEALKTSQMTQQERAELESALDDMKKQFMTKEQQAAQEKQKLESTLKTEMEAYKTEAVTYKTKFNEFVITNALESAAKDHDAFNPEQVVMSLRNKTKLLNDEPVVDFEDVHLETGERIVTQMTPAAAVKRMKEIAKYGNLFKSNVATGIGGSNGTGAPTGKIDVRKLTSEQYMELRKTNPKALYGS